MLTNVKKRLLKKNPEFSLIVCLAALSLTPIAPGTAFTRENPVNLSFSSAWRMVTTENNKLKAAREKITQETHAAESYKDLYLPEITLSSNYLHLDKDVQLTPNDILAHLEEGSLATKLIGTLAHSYKIPVSLLNSALTSTLSEQNTFMSSLTATWPIYTGGRITAANDIARSKIKEADFDLQLQSLERFEQLIRFYFGAVLAKRVLNTRLEVEKGLQQHREHARLMEKQGQIAKVETMQAEAAYDKSVVERKKAERDHEIAIAALTRIIQSSAPVHPADPLFIAEELPEQQSFIRQSLANHPGLAILQQKQTQAQKAAAIEKGKYYPSVAVMGNYSLYEEDDLTHKLLPDWFAGIGVQIPILSRSGRYGKMQAAKSAEKRIVHMQAQTRSDLSLLIEKTYRQAEQALEEFKGLRSSIQLAKETVELRNKAFKQGLGTSLDVVDAELFLASVKTQRAVAVYNYVLALGRLCVAENSPEDFFTYQNNNGIENN